jgi:hypothetical protein
LVITAIFDETSFEIVDDRMDGDTYDSKSGVLSRGQSYILYIADNGINDDTQYASGRGTETRWRLFLLFGLVKRAGLSVNEQ